MLSGIELVVLIVAVVALVIWGPKKLPEFAKAIGQARGEFSKASKSSSAEVSGPTEPQSNATTSSDDILIQTAKKLGINTEGKTKEQLSQEIVDLKTNPKNS